MTGMSPALSPAAQAFDDHRYGGWSEDRAKPELCACGETFATNAEYVEHAAAEVVHANAEAAGSYNFTQRIDDVLQDAALLSGQATEGQPPQPGHLPCHPDFPSDDCTWPRRGCPYHDPEYATDGQQDAEVPVCHVDGCPPCHDSTCGRRPPLHVAQREPRGQATEGQQDGAP